MKIKGYLFTERIQTYQNTFEIKVHLKNLDKSWHYLNDFLEEDSDPSPWKINILKELIKNETLHLTENFLCLDKEKNIIYIGDSQEYDEATYDEINFKETYPDLSDLQMLQQEKMGSFQLPKDNFIHIIKVWDQLVKMEAPFALIYQDENDWIDAKPFGTQEAMEQFIKDHS